MLSEKTLEKIKERNKNNKITVSNIEKNIEGELPNQQEYKYNSKKSTRPLEGNLRTTIGDLKDKECCKDESENCSIDFGAQAAINNESKSNRITVSKIAKNIEEDSSNQQEDCIPIKTSRTLERNFVRIVEALEENKEDFKDEDGNYSVDLSGQAALAAILVESTKKDSLVDKLMRGKAENVDIKDTIAYFDNLIKYTDGKMDERERIEFLLLQDECVEFSLTTILFNIQHTLMAMYKNMQVYPYEYQVGLMQELFREVFVKFNENVANDVIEFAKSNILKRLIEKDIPGVNEYPNKEFEEYYKKIDDAVTNLLNDDVVMREKIEKDLKCNINEL